MSPTEAASEYYISSLSKTTLFKTTVHRSRSENYSTSKYSAWKDCLPVCAPYKLSELQRTFLTSHPFDEFLTLNSLGMSFVVCMCLCVLFSLYFSAVIRFSCKADYKDIKVIHKYVHYLYMYSYVSVFFMLLCDQEKVESAL